MTDLKVSIIKTGETVFFSTIKGKLRQHVVATITNGSGEVLAAEVEIKAASQTVRTPVAITPGTADYKCYAPCLWPDTESVKDAPLKLILKDGAIISAVSVGGHRPWTIYLLSDICADDTWAYDDLAMHDEDDYKTTLAEMNAPAGNAYNFAAVYQVDRFMRAGSTAEKNKLRQNLRSGRIYCTPMPDQLMCGAFLLSACPIILEPYRRLVLPNLPKGDFCAYHMEATTWTNGITQLCADAGFNLFAKSLLHYQAPWLDALKTIPRLTRLEVAPGRFVYLLLRVGDYAEGRPMFEGLERTEKYLHEEVIPAHEKLGEAYPASAIPLVGMYGDLAPRSPIRHLIKMAVVRMYNGLDWEYPKLVNASWRQFGEHIERELGEPARPKRKGLVTVRGDGGASWEVWMLAAQTENAAFRKAQRDVVSLRTLGCLCKKWDKKNISAIETASDEVAYLGDHAWNGSSDGSKFLNLAVRRRRLGVVGRSVEAVRAACLAGKALVPGRRIAVVNTLGWERTCPANLSGASKGCSLKDIETGRIFGPSENGEIMVPRVPAFGARVMEIVRPSPTAGGKGRIDKPILSRQGMRPMLFLDDKEAEVAGRWSNDQTGRWTAGPFRVSASLAAGEGGAEELTLEVAGQPPKEAYELRFGMALPWKWAVWRGEMGGGFVTPGPTDKGGDSLLGVVGSVFSCGEGLSAADVGRKERIDLAFDQSGMCGLGGRITARAVGYYHEKVPVPEMGAVMDKIETPGVLEWYLLATAQNYREAFPDQGGQRNWTFRCVMRRSAGAFDDQNLYQFAAGCNWPAELVDPAVLAGTDSAMQINASAGLLPLGMNRKGTAVELDCYNASNNPADVKLAGPIVKGRKVRQADMLGRPMPGKGIKISAKSFRKIIVG